MLFRRWGWAFALAGLFLACLLALFVHAIGRDFALVRGDFSAEYQHMGKSVDYALEYGAVGVVPELDWPMLQAKMQPAAGKMPGLGFKYYQGGVLWFSFVVPSLATDQTDWAIRLDDFRVRTARLYVVRDGQLDEKVWQHDDPSHLAGIGTRVPIFSFKRSEIEGQTVVIGFNALGALRADVSVETQRVTNAAEMREAIQTSLMVGGTFAMAAYLLIIGLSLKAPTLLAASGVSLFTGMFVYGAKGFLKSGLFSAMPNLGDAILYGGQPFMMMFILLLIVAFLDLPRAAPRVAAAVVLIALLLPFQGVLILALAAGLPVPYVSDFTGPVLVGMLTAILTLTWFTVFKRDQRAGVFFLCLTPLAISGAARVYLYFAASADPFWLNLTDSFLDVVLTMGLLCLVAVLDLQRRDAALRDTAQQNEQRFRAYAEIASDSYFEVDNAGMLVRSAGRLARRLKLDEGVPFGTALAMAAAPGQTEALSTLDQVISHPRNLRDIELAARSGSDAGAWLSLSVTPWQSGSGAGMGLRGTIADVSDQVARREREAREATLLALGQLAGGVAHEVNNLLHPIVNLSRRVRDTIGQDEESRKLLDLVVTSGLHAGEIVAGVLNSFNPARTPGTVRPLGDALADALIAMRATLPSTIALREVIEPGSTVLVAPGEMLQIMSNLLSNSVRAMDGHGSIVVSLKFADDETTELAVTDDGPGMPEAVRLRATEPFVSGRSTGTGLGLSVVANIVRKWHGALDIQSAPGAGTRVSITIARPQISLERANLPEGA